MNIVLIGFMGCGKSTIGKKIARHLNYEFIDIDKEIEKIENKSISDIFNEKGESYFRILENKFLVNNTFKNTVLSVGGGTPCFNDNMEILNKIGQTVYINMNVRGLANRLINAKQKRPLIEDYKSSNKELEVRINNLLNERVRFYRQAKIIFNGINFNPKRVEDLIKLINY